MGAFPPEGKQLIPERQLVLNTKAAYTDAIGIADERWNASAARECRNRSLTLTTDVLALGGIAIGEEGRCVFAPAFFVARVALLARSAADVEDTRIPPPERFRGTLA